MSKTRYPQGNLKGVNTPWTPDFELDEARFVGQVEHLLDAGYRHLYILGTAGEGHALNDAAYERLVDVFCGVVGDDDVFPQVGVITLSTEHAIERIRYGVSRGSTMFQIALPSWGAMSTAEKIDYFTYVCGLFPDTRFLHYNYPRAVNVMSPAEYEAVVEAVPNLVATKISTMDMGQIRGLMTRAGELQHFFLQGGFPYASLFGECSLISSLGPVFPKTSHRLFEAGRDGDVATAFAIQRRLIDVAEGVARRR